jgi:hypothetical protein
VAVEVVCGLVKSVGKAPLHHTQESAMGCVPSSPEWEEVIEVIAVWACILNPHTCSGCMRAAEGVACSARVRWLAGGQQQRWRGAHACGDPTGGLRSSVVQCTRAVAPWGQQQRRHAAHASSGGPTWSL